MFEKRETRYFAVGCVALYCGLVLAAVLLAWADTKAWAQIAAVGLFGLGILAATVFGLAIRSTWLGKGLLIMVALVILGVLGFAFAISPSLDRSISQPGGSSAAEYDLDMEDITMEYDDVEDAAVRNAEPESRTSGEK